MGTFQYHRGAEVLWDEEMVKGGEDTSARER